MQEKSNIQRRSFPQYLIGILVVGVGVSLMFHANKGLSAFDSVSYNFHDLLKIHIFLAVLTISFIVTVIAFFINPNKKEVLLSLICTFLVSLIIGGLQELFAVFPNREIFKWIYLIIGVFLTPIGASLMIDSGYPPSAVDVTIKGANRRWGWKVGTLKYATEILFFIIAVSMCLIFGDARYANGNWCGYGIGTVLLMTTSGKIMQVTLNILRRGRKNESKQND